MFLAGTELELATMRRGHLGRAVGSWGVSLLFALGVGLVLHSTGLVLDHVVVALCLTTTALGTLLPILRDAGVLQTKLGPSVLSVGAIGEFGPIVAVAVLLTNRDPRLTFLLLVALRRRGRHRRAPGDAGPSAPLRRADAAPPPLDLTTAGQDLGPARHPAGVPGDKLSLDVLLGAFAAGVVVRLFITGEDSEPITSKLEAIGFGFLIPIFFIESGITFDLHALVHQPKVLLLVPMFTAIFLLTRGLPTWAFFRGVLTRVEARSLAVLASTGLPIIVVITTIGVDEHRMKPQNAAALVAAGMLSVLIYPVLALGWLGKGRGATAAGPRPEQAAEDDQ